MQLIEFKSLHKKFKDDLILENINFSINKGEIVGIIGPNGIGKSTTLSLITGLSKASEGQVIYYDEKDFKKKLGYVPQSNALYDNLTGFDNLSFYYDILGVNGNKKEIINKIGKYLDIEKHLDKKVSKYSGGMKRKLDIAAALLNNPEILIMDEPTAGLDIVTRNSIASLIKDLNKEGKTVIFTSHYVSEMKNLCDKIILLKDKKIIFQGSIKELNNEYPEIKSIEEIYLYLYS
jgi:ABC-2 type transport system ATP-binding protein